MFWAVFSDYEFLFEVLGLVPSGRASADFATLQNILRMVPLRILRIPRAIVYIKILF